MKNITTIGLDMAKRVFQVHGMDHEGQAVLRKKLRRGQVLNFLRPYRHVWLEWKRVVVRSTGPESSAPKTTRCD